MKTTFPCSLPPTTPKNAHEPGGIRMHWCEFVVNNLSNREIRPFVNVLCLRSLIRVPSCPFVVAPKRVAPCNFARVTKFQLAPGKAREWQRDLGLDMAA